ncbi:AMP-binding protein [Paraflavitalea speifideaquila]|uniref:AMP-binding protein n=1 Tax=Paraflavitalea speifideaquila TaxID=3076558 RepID=UPI0028E1D07C|nr:AMP-binding protein [Paraflavitalea speifideiaquila]
MTEPRRLFDCIQYQLEGNPLPVMLAGKENGQWRTYNTQEVKETVDKLSAGLLNLGVTAGDGTAEGRDKITVMSKNRPEWLMLDLAVQQLGAVLTPVYPTISISELEFILQDAQVKMVFVNDEELFHKVMHVKDNIPSLKTIYTFEQVPGANHWKEILALGDAAAAEKVKTIAASIQLEDLATIIYTSGTTGKPKGVMLSHHNILSNVMDSIPCFPPGENMRALSFLPLNHVFERMVSYIYLFKRTSIYYAESLETIGDNLKEVKPTMFTTVPRLLEKVYDRIMAKGQSCQVLRRNSFSGRMNWLPVLRSIRIWALVTGCN